CRDVTRHEQDAFQATFLVLARQPGSLRKQSSLASCLYGVAKSSGLPPPPGLAAPCFDAATITAGPDGNLYFTSGLIGNWGIGRITTDGTATLIFNQDPGSELFRGITVGSDGNLWLTEPVSIGQFVLGDGIGAGGAAAVAPAAGLAQAVSRLGGD